MTTRHTKPTSADIDELHGFPLFNGFSLSETAKALADFGAHVKRFEKGAVVVHEGTPADWLVVVLEGKLNIYELIARDERHLVRPVLPGQLFGGTLVMSACKRYPGLAQAAQAARVVFLSISRIQAAVADRRSATLFRNLYSIVSGDVLKSWRKMSIMACTRAEDRVKLLLNWVSSIQGRTEFDVPFNTTEEMAQFLAISRTALSLAINRLVRRGEIVHPGRRHFSVKPAK